MKWWNRQANCIIFDEDSEEEAAPKSSTSEAQVSMVAGVVYDLVCLCGICG